MWPVTLTTLNNILDFQSDNTYLLDLKLSYFLSPLWETQMESDCHMVYKMTTWKFCFMIRTDL